nr:hypothetical protein CFP56_62463 [Quercus suber]
MNLTLTDILILLHSKRTSTVMSFRISIVRDFCTLVTDPCIVDSTLPPGDQSQIVDLNMVRVSTGDRGKRWESSVAESLVSQLKQENVHLFALTALHLDGMISQTLFVDFTRARNQVTVGTPTWSIAPRFTSATKLKKATFVVSDSDEWEVSNELGNHRRPLCIQRRASPSSFMAQQTVHHGTTSYAQVCRSLDSQETDHDKVAESTLDLVANLLQKVELAEVVPFKTLFELRSAGITSVANLETLSARLEELTHDGTAKNLDTDRRPANQESNSLAIHSLAWSHGLLEIYHHMIDDWITPLSMRVHGRLRISKDSIIRDTATEVALSTRLIRADVVDEPDDEDLPTTEDISNPVLTSLSQRDSGLPTPSLTATPSVSTAHSVSTSQTSAMHPLAELARLSRYTVLDPESTSTHLPTQLPRSLANVLSHWALGEDPQEYDWAESARRVMLQRYREDEEGMGEKEQRFSRRKVERHIKRQRREAEEMERNRVQSSQATMVMSSQLPERTKGSEGSRPIASSSQLYSQGGDELVTASQVVPGRFGGRPEPTPKKRKRKQGF